MREYSKVSPRFWIGRTGKAIKAQGSEAVIVAMYLMTSPNSNMLGLYYCPIPLISHETGLTLQGASKGLQRAFEAGFCSYDEASEMVWVYEMAKFQIGEKLDEKDNRVKGIQKEYESLPECPFLLDFFQKYSDRFRLKIARGSEAPSKPLRSQEQEQEQDNIEIPKGILSGNEPDVTPHVDPQPAKKEKIPFAEIVGYLNEKAGVSYKASSKETVSLIRARWKQGFRFDDFKKIIDHRCAEWLTDDKYAQYLRPQTLFGTKFESYLQAAKAHPAGETNLYGKFGKWKEKEPSAGPR